MPKAPPLVTDGGWVTSILASSSSNEPPPIRAPTEAGTVTGEAPAPSPLLEGSEPLRIPSATLAVGDGPGHVLKFAHERGVVRHELFEDAMGTLSRLGGELVDVNARLEAEGLRLVEEWHQLKVAINLGRLQHEHANARAEASLATSRKASARAFEEARGADHCRSIAKERGRELQALNASLEQQVEVRRAALAPMKGVSSNEEEISRHEEALLLEATERSLELEWLETRERQVAQAEDVVRARGQGPGGGRPLGG